MYFLELSQILISVLAIASIVNIISRERAFHWLHQLLGDTYDDDGNLFAISDGALAYMFRCRTCLSVWVGILVATGWFLAPKITSIVLIPFMLSQLTLFFYQWLEKNYGTS